MTGNELREQICSVLLEILPELKRNVRCGRGWTAWMTPPPNSLSPRWRNSMVDTSIRQRLLELPNVFRLEGLSLLDAQTCTAKLRMAKEITVMRITAEAAKSYPEKSNKETRDALLGEALSTDHEYEVLQRDLQIAEEKGHIHTFMIDALKFEQKVLLGVLAADTTEE